MRKKWFPPSRRKLKEDRLKAKVYSKAKLHRSVDNCWAISEELRSKLHKLITDDRVK